MGSANYIESDAVPFNMLSLEVVIHNAMLGSGTDFAPQG
jgi:hypothetical protein